MNGRFKQSKHDALGQIGVDLDIRHRKRADVADLLVEIDVIALEDLARGERRAVFDIGKALFLVDEILQEDYADDGYCNGYE